MKIKSGAFILFGLVVLAAVFVNVEIDGEIFIAALSVTTFLFSVITVSAIGDRQQRMMAIRDQNSLVRAMLVQISYLSGAWGQKFEAETKRLIDEYLVSVFMFKITDQQYTDPYFEALYRHVIDSDVSTNKRSSAFGNMTIAFREFIVARQKLAALIKDGLPKLEVWLSEFLGALIIISLLILNTGSPASIVVVVGLSGIVIFLLSLVLSLERLDYSYESRIVEPYQITFEELGLPRYYPVEFLEKRHMQFIPKDRPFRVGTFKGAYPDTAQFRVDTIDPTQGDK